VTNLRSRARSGNVGEWDAVYRHGGLPPWEIEAAQPAFVNLADAGAFHSPILDIGCGTGENALMLAARGHDVVGVDLAPSAIERARTKARERGLTARFEVGNALELDRIGFNQPFAAAIDSGCFHVFATDAEVARYVSGAHSVLAPGATLHLMCFSDAEPGTWGPRRVSEAELREAFADGWAIESIEPTFFATRAEVGGRAHAWLAHVVRV
jgi:cyclopropane fatty-acyl-phospholipid synthase-like methyltransferase